MIISERPNNPRGGAQEITGTAWGGKVTSEQGHRTHPSTGEKGTYHRGIDIASKTGTPLTANVSGRVIASGSAKSFGYSDSYGNIVVIQDSQGNKHLYGHMDKASAKVGSTVHAGAHLGTVGSTGRSTGPHVHYEVTNGGKVLNAKNWMA